MESNQRELRRAASRAFIESLDKLHEALAIEATPPPQKRSNGHASEPIRPQPKVGSFDLDTLEQAVEDIEQFMQSRQQPPIE
jgi:hypothetical protein